MRATPPYLPALSEALQKTLATFATSEDTLARYFRQSQYDWCEETRSSGVEWIGTRVKLAPAVDKMMVTSGATSTILLLTSFLVPPGTVLLAEELTLPQVYAIAKITSVRVQSVRIDQQGLLPDDLEQKCKHYAPKAIYLNCTVHSPTTHVTPIERRRAIADIARKYGVQIIEDDSQALFLDDLPDSFATIAPDITWYSIGLSGYFGDAVRLAFVVAPSACDLAAVHRGSHLISTWRPAPLTISIATHWIRTGVARTLLQLVRTETRKRQQIASELLSEIDGFRGSNGTHFWLPTPTGVDSEQFSRALAEAGIIVRASKLYAGDYEPRLQGIRSGVGEPVDVDQLRRAMEIIRDIYYRFWFGALP
nr:PLP-dependent aminotransferase family protein [Bradyrhizobium sp. 168]